MLKGPAVSCPGAAENIQIFFAFGQCTQIHCTVLTAQYSAQYSSNAVYPKSKTLGFIANIRKNYFAGQPETKTTLHCATKYIMLLARNLNFCTFCLTLHYNWLAVGCS